MADNTGPIFTNHARKRLQERGISQMVALEAFTSPDKIERDSKDRTVFIKRKEASRISIVATQNEKSEWIILSCWMDPPLPGTKDAKRKEAYRKYQHASPFKKIVLTIKQQLGF